MYIGLHISHTRIHSLHSHWTFQSPRHPLFRQVMVFHLPHSQWKGTTLSVMKPFWLERKESGSVVHAKTSIKGTALTVEYIQHSIYFLLNFILLSIPLPLSPPLSLLVYFSVTLSNSVILSLSLSPFVMNEIAQAKNAHCSRRNIRVDCRSSICLTPGRPRLQLYASVKPLMIPLWSVDSLLQSDEQWSVSKGGIISPSIAPFCLDKSWF